MANEKLNKQIKSGIADALNLGNFNETDSLSTGTNDNQPPSKYQEVRSLPKTKHLSLLVIPTLYNDFKKSLPRKTSANDTINKLMELYIKTNGECLNALNEGDEIE